MSSASAGRFFTTELSEKAPNTVVIYFHPVLFLMLVFEQN